MSEGELGDFNSLLEEYDAEDEAVELHVGDHVAIEDRDATALVVARVVDRTAREYRVEGEKTVADYHDDEHADDEVFLVVFPSRTDVDTQPLKRYAYPRGVLELETPVHSRDEGGDD